MFFFYKGTKSDSSMNAALDSDFSDAWLYSTHPHTHELKEYKRPKIDKQKVFHAQNESCDSHVQSFYSLKIVYHPFTCMLHGISSPPYTSVLFV